MKYLAIPLALMLGGNVMADTISKQFQVVAEVPTAAFYVMDEGGWMSNQQRLVYNVESSAFEPITGNRLVARSTTGAIEAHLDSDAVITSGGDRIDLNIAVNGVDLSTTKQEVITAADAANPYYMPVVISATAGTYQPGDYMGFVNMTFEPPDP